MVNPLKLLGGLNAVAKGEAKAIPKLTKVEAAGLRSRGFGVPGVDFADPLAPATMRMSEALGNAGAEGKYLNLSQADRSRVFGPNKGGTGFSGLQLTSEPHQQARSTWGVGKKSHLTRLTNATDPETVWSTFIGSPTQHMSNPVTVERMYEAHKKANPSAELVGKMNEMLNAAVNKKGNPVFPGGIDISDPSALSQAQTFDQRKLLAQAMVIGGEKKGEKAAQEAFKVIKEETDPLLMDAPTYAVGNRLFTIDKNSGIYRPDLNAAFPHITTGTDFGLIFEPAPIELAAPTFVKRFEGRLNKNGKLQPMGHKDLTATTPREFVSEDYLTNLQKEGNKDGGAIKADHGSVDIDAADARLAAAMQQRMAKGGEVDIAAADARLADAMAQRMAGGGIVNIHPDVHDILNSPPINMGVGGLLKGIAKKGAGKIDNVLPMAERETNKAKKLFASDVLPTAEREANLQKFLAPSAEKRRMYHGSKEPNIKEFKTRKEMTDESMMTGHYADERDAVFLSPEPSFTTHFSKEGYTDTHQAPTTYPVHVQIERPFDFDNPEHLGKVKETYLDMYHNPDSDLYDPHMLPSERSMAIHTFNKRVDNLPNDENNWARIENQDFQDVLKDLGFDSFYTRERGTKNLGVYEPNRIKSAIGNRGTYDLGEPDINKAGGGLLKSAAKGVKRLFADDALPALEREFNLQKFLEPSKAQMRLYHGTTATEGGKGTEAIRRIKPSKEGALGSGVYLTPKTAHASGYTGIPNDEALDLMRGSESYSKMADQFMADRAAGTLREGQAGGNMLPVHAQIRNPLIIEGTHGDPMIEALMKLGMDESSASRMVERAYENKGYIGKEVQTRAQAQGYDGLMQYRDGDLNEVVSYNPNAVKSAIGNRGTYDLNEPDLSKAGGGLAHMAPGGLLKSAGKGLKRMFGEADDFAPRGGTRKFGPEAGGLNIIKEPNGNWLTGSVEKSLSPLKREVRDGEKTFYNELKAAHERKPPSEQRSRSIRAVEGEIALLNRNEALNKWVESNLSNYVKKQMGTKDDPVRKLAEQGITPVNPEQLNFRLEAHGKHMQPGQTAVAQSDAAKRWEGASDLQIGVSKASDHLMDSLIEPGTKISLINDNDWLAKVPPETKVHRLIDFRPSDLGFDHIMDVLREDITAGRIRPEQLNKVSMEQAVRRAHEYDAELAAKQNAARAARREGLPVHKEYPEGYKWLQLNKPGSFAAESEAMGHSVKGYEPPKGHPDWNESSGDVGNLGYGHGGWEAIKSGKAKVYSLVNAKGEPHVTVEAAAHNPNLESLYAKENLPELYQKYSADRNRYFNSWPEFLKAEAPELLADNAVKITQIKGKGNRAPNEEYLPFVQDFVKSGKWSDVGDIQNTGLYKADPEELGMFIPSDPRLKNLPGRRTDDLKRAKEAGLFGDQKYLTRNEWEDILRKQIESESGPLPPVEGMAEGGGAFKTLQWAKGYDEGGITTSAGTFTPEELGVTKNDTVPNKALTAEIVKGAGKHYNAIKQDLATDYDRLKNSERARAQLAKIAGAGFVGGLYDVAGMITPLVNSDALLSAFPMQRLAKIGVTGTPSLGRRESVLSGETVPYSLADYTNDKEGNPFGGSERLIKRAQDVGLMYGRDLYDENGNVTGRTGRFHPLLEFGSSILGGAAASKAARGAVNTGKGFARGFDKGYTRAMTRDQPPFLRELEYNPVRNEQPLFNPRPALPRKRGGLTQIKVR